MTTQFKQMLQLAQKEQLNLKNNNVSLDRNQLFIGAQFNDQEKLLTSLQIDDKTFIFSAIDHILIQKPEIKSKIENYILGQSNLDVFDEMLKYKLNDLEVSDVLEVAQTLIEVNGSVTTLELKQQLRDNGFRCDQRNVSNFANELYLENFLEIKAIKDNYRVYVAGSKMQTIELDNLNFIDEETEINKNEVENEIKVEFKTLQERNERNNKI